MAAFRSKNMNYISSVSVMKLGFVVLIIQEKLELCMVFLVAMAN